MTTSRPTCHSGEHPVFYPALSSIVIIAVFLPLTVARYRRVASR